MNQKGLAPILIILFIAATLGGYFIYHQSKSAITQDEANKLQDKLPRVEILNIQPMSLP